MHNSISRNLSRVPIDILTEVDYNKNSNGNGGKLAMQNEVPGQLLDHNALYRIEWNRLTQSRLYLAFVLSFMIWSACAVIYGIYTIIVQIITTPNFQELIGVVFVEILVTEPFAVGLVAMNVGFWLIRGKREKCQSAGLRVMFWTYVVLLTFTILLFLITLPMFTEWLPYQESYGRPLQIVYCIYIFMGIEDALAIATLKSLHNNLGLWEGSRGPVIALGVLLILRSLAVWGISVWVGTWDGNSAMVGLLSTLPMDLLIILLFRYRAAVLKVK